MTAAASRPALAATNTLVSATVTGQTSSGAVVPTTNGNNWFYDYSVPVGSAITDTISVQVCEATTSLGDGAGYPNTLEIDAPSGSVPGVTNDKTGLTYNAEGCQSFTISVNTGALGAAGNLAANIDVKKDTEPTKTNVTVVSGNIHIRVNVYEVTSTTSCFLTDSGFGFLVDCSGTPVTTGSEGWFAIVANRKNTAVSTNPGQFYYNVLWTNTTGADKTVSVSFVRTNVLAKGAQAIHAKTFPSFPTLNASNFEDVNEENPSGSNDALESILVKDGYTLWVTYHLEWSGLGSPTATAPTVCGEAPVASVSVQATIAETGGGILGGPCTAGASGYRK